MEVFPDRTQMSDDKLPPSEKSFSDEDLPSAVKLSLWSFIAVVLLVCTAFAVNQHDFKRAQAVAGSAAVSPPANAAPAEPSLANFPMPTPARANADTNPTTIQSIMSPSASEQLTVLPWQEPFEPNKPAGTKRGVAASSGCPIALALKIRPGCNTFSHTEIAIQ